MREGVTGAEHTLAILSRAYLGSVYGMAEWQAAYRADPQGLRRKLIPVRVEDCERPDILGEVVSFDLFGLTAEDARRHLLDTVGHALAGRAKPAAPPAFPTPTPPRPPSAPPAAEPAFPGPASPAPAGSHPPEPVPALPLTEPGPRKPATPGRTAGRPSHVSWLPRLQHRGARAAATVVLLIAIAGTALTASSAQGEKPERDQRPPTHCTDDTHSHSCSRSTEAGFPGPPVG
jgi:hypothetical protein